MQKTITLIKNKILLSLRQKPSHRNQKVTNHSQGTIAFADLYTFTQITSAPFFNHKAFDLRESLHFFSLYFCLYSVFPENTDNEIQ
jgi:hypothetical protein